MTVKPGDIVKGKVSGVAAFGCFIDFSDNQRGLCHISEVSHEYVKDINEQIKVGDEVEAKVLEVKDGKVQLSIKAMTEPPKVEKTDMSFDGGPANSKFDDLMAKFIKESNEKIQSINQRNSRRRGSNKPRK